MKRLIVSVLLLLIATLVFSQAKSNSQDDNANDTTVKESAVQVKHSPTELG
ncbi:hypothetical protein [Formosa sp. A9]|uniref:hypothetical protein n=1 Tax=Formosa sp. A9 TaxID=3442641 RepID=UPI003EBF1717